jgi:predicted nucleic acid-binding protein
VSRDPDDDYLIALALAARAHVVVSADAHLLDIPAPPVGIATPHAFLSLLPE